MEAISLKFSTKNPKQWEAGCYWNNSDVEEILYGGAKYGGKSFLGCALIFSDALTYPNTNYFIARQELNDLHKFTVSSIQEVFSYWGLKFDDYAKYNGQDHAYYLTNGSKVFFIACKETPTDPLYERFGSMQMTRGWIEEASEIVGAAKANLWLSIGRWNNDKYKLKKKLLLTCNPKKGWLKWEYIDPFFSNSLPSSKRVILSRATDNVHGSKDYIKSLSEEKDKVRRQRLWEGNWNYDEDLANLFSFSALTDMFTNTVTKSGEKYLTVDVAGEGDDKTVFGFWDDLELYRIEEFQGLNTETIIGKIKEYAAAEKIPYSHIAVDAIGIGEGVATSSLLNGIIGYKASYAAIKTDASPVLLPNVHYLKEARLVSDYKNLRSQCIFVLSDLVNNHKIAARIEDQAKKTQIIDELFMYQNVSTTDNKREATAKDDVKEALGRSPDCFIAGTKVLTPSGEKNIEDIKIGDEVITPFRTSKVVYTVKKYTDELFTLDNKLTGTGNHKIFTGGGFSTLDSFLMRVYTYYEYNWYNRIVWKVLSLLSTKARSIGFREMVNTFTTVPIKKESGRKESLSIGRFGLIIIRKRFLMGMTSIILTVIHSTIFLITYSVFRSKSMLGIISKRCGKIITNLIYPIYGESLYLQKNGTLLMRGGSGIVRRQSMLGKRERKEYANVKTVEASINLLDKVFVQITVLKDTVTELVNTMKKEFVLFVEKLLVSGKVNLQKHAQELVRQKCDGIPVYSLTLETDNVYFANGILVSNCSDIMLIRMYFHIRSKMLPYEAGANSANLDRAIEEQFLRNQNRAVLNSSK